MPLQIMQNLYPVSWLYLTGHCYVRSIFVKHNFVAVVVCLLLLLFFIIIIVIIIIIITIIYYCYDLFFLLLLSSLFLIGTN